MANGILGTAALTSSTNTTVYTVPAATFSIITINVTNRNAASRAIRIGISASATPADAEWIEYDAELLGNGVIERSGIVVDAGKNIVAYADSTDINVLVYGIETPTS